MFYGHERNMLQRHLTTAVRTKSMYFQSPTNRCKHRSFMNRSETQYYFVAKKDFTAICM